MTRDDRPIGYWDEVDESAGPQHPVESRSDSDRSVDLDDDERETVLDRIVDDLDDVEELYGVCPTTRRGDVVYVLVSYARSNDAGRAVDLRTVAVDLGDESVRVTDNGLWVPEDSAVLAVLSRAVSAARGLDDEGLTTASAVDDLDVDSLLSHTVRDSEAPEQDRNDSAPEEIYSVDERLREAGVDVEERYNRLKFGGKDPWEHDLRSTETIIDNYGVYATEEDDLLLVDVDDPEALDATLPTTYTVTSPHGSAERCHRYYVVEDLDAWRDTFDRYNLGPEWGDVRTVRQYVVGPGSQLDGCDKDPCSGSPPCSEPDGGRYEVVLDRPIERVSVDDLLPALSECLPDEQDEQDAPGRGADARDGVDPDTPQDAPEPSQDDESETVTCYQCNRLLKRSEAVLHASDEDRDYFRCKGGCPT